MLIKDSLIRASLSADTVVDVLIPLRDLNRSPQPLSPRPDSLTPDKHIISLSTFHSCLISLSTYHLFWSSVYRQMCFISFIRKLFMKHAAVIDRKGDYLLFFYTFCIEFYCYEQSSCVFWDRGPVTIVLPCGRKQGYNMKYHLLHLQQKCVIHVSIMIQQSMTTSKC